MRENTPPRAKDIRTGDGRTIDSDDDEMEEITIEELEAITGQVSEEDEDSGPECHSDPDIDDAAVTFKEHTNAVFGCALHPDLPLAVTGGEDDHAYVWDVQTCEVVYEISEHKDTVTHVYFNHDGTYLATGDMAGELFVHKLQQNELDGQWTFRKVWEYSMGDMTWMMWHRASNVLIAGSENGEVYVWRIPGGDCKILPSAGLRSNVGDLAFDGRNLFVGYSSGVVKLWDLKNCTVAMEVDPQNPMAHDSDVLALACEKESPLYAAGSANGKIVFYTKTGPVGAVEADGSVECISFPPSNDLKIVASGTLNGQIAIWDYTKYTLRTLCEDGVVPTCHCSITAINWLSNFTLIAASTSGKIIAFDVRTGTFKFTLRGHVAEIYEMCFHPEAYMVLTSSEDHRAKIFYVHPKDYL